MPKARICFLFLLVAVAFTGCSRAQLDAINTDPTKVTGANFDPNALLSSAQLGYANTGYHQLVYESTMMQVLASTYYYYNNGDKYINEANFTSYQGAIFGQDYAESSTIRQMQALCKQRDSTQYTNLIAIGDIMFVLALQRITDMYGDCPYTQADMAQLGVKYPIYDLQKDIYNDMLQDLDIAINRLDGTKPRPTADLFYNGDISKWKKFGYSLMLRVAMRLTKVDPVTARNWAEHAANGGTFAGPMDNAIVPTDASNSNGQNATSVAMRTLTDYEQVRWSATLINYLRSTNDPRLNVIGEIPPAGLTANRDETLSGVSDSALQTGMPNGYDLLGGATDISKAPGYPGGTGTGADFAPLGKYSRPRTSLYLKLNGPVFILTYAETELLLSEAAVRNWSVSGSASEHYANAVTGAMQSLTQQDSQTEISAADISNYLTKNPLDISSVDASLKMINTQYWITTGTNFNFIENWFNWRRSGYPVLTPINYPGNVTGGTIPRRMIYLSTEILTNPTNYKLAVSRLAGGDQLTSRVWWDVAQ
jgi:hypothetical protein